MLCRHLMGDWGDLDAEDKAANDRAAKEVGRLVSVITCQKQARRFG
jgi:hypothetical protein